MREDPWAELARSLEGLRSAFDENNHVRVLQEHADYEPQTEWEKAELGLVAAGGPR